MKIKGLLVIPGEKVQKVKIPGNLKFIRRLIGEELVRIKLDENTILLLNKNAREDNFNRILGSRIVNGTFLILGIKNKHRISLKKRQIRKYMNMFKLEKHEKRVNQYREEYFLKKYMYNFNDCRLNENKEKYKNVA